MGEPKVEEGERLPVWNELPGVASASSLDAALAPAPASASQHQPTLTSTNQHQLAPVSTSQRLPPPAPTLAAPEAAIVGALRYKISDKMENYGINHGRALRTWENSK